MCIHALAALDIRVDCDGIRWQCTDAWKETPLLWSIIESYIFSRIKNDWSLAGHLSSAMFPKLKLVQLFVCVDSLLVMETEAKQESLTSSDGLFEPLSSRLLLISITVRCPEFVRTCDVERQKESSIHFRYQSAVSMFIQSILVSNG